MYSREERTRLTGEINDMSAFIPGAERYFRRSLHVKNCRDRLIISSGFQEKRGCPLYPSMFGNYVEYGIF